MKRGTCRRWAVAIATASLVPLVLWGGVMIYRGDHKAYVYARRIADLDPQLRLHSFGEAWRVVEANLHSLGNLRAPSARKFLERYAVDSRVEKKQARALHLLAKFYPDSWISQGMRKFTEIRGHYLGRQWGPRLNASQVASLERWVREFPGHPGSDDALQLLGRAAMDRGDLLSAFNLLLASLDAPDGDCWKGTTRRLRGVLSQMEDPDMLWAASRGKSPEVAAILVYREGLMSLRAGDYARASSVIVAPLNRLKFLQSTRLTRWLYRAANSEFPQRVEDQRALAAALLRLQEEHDATADTESKAAAVHQMGRLCFHSHRLFGNYLFRGNYLFDSRQKTGDINDLKSTTGYAHAAKFFQRVVAEYPDYSRLADVEYSIPLCLWRLRNGRFINGSFDAAIARSFQAFADKYPESSMSDEALFVAGWYDYYARGGKSDVLHRNLARIAADYQEGNLVGEASQHKLLAHHVNLRKTAAREAEAKTTEREILLLPPVAETDIRRETDADTVKERQRWRSKVVGTLRVP